MLDKNKHATFTRNVTLTLIIPPDDEGEGFVTIHNGIHGIGGMEAATYDWRNPVAKIVIKQVR